MEKENKYLPWISLGVFLLYFAYQELTPYIVDVLEMIFGTFSLGVRASILLFIELLFIISLFFIYKQRFIKDFKDFKNNFKKYIKKYMDYWAIAFALMVICNIVIVTLLPNSTATNQEAINMILKKAPIYMLVSSVLFAPFVEETVFRLSFRNIFQNDKVFIFIAGIVFGAFHVVGSFESWVDLAYILPYSVPGFVFAYTLVKSKNIFVPMSLHFFHNGIMMFVQFVIFFLLTI